jgi:DNA-binding transcriptional regulator YhcF (GntR family)
LKPRPVLPDSSGPLYERVRHVLERMALSRPLDDDTPLPPEPRLMEEFGVSRGTLRRAVEELTRDGLLSAEQGRGTYVNHEERVRRVVWQRLETVARPDSRFDLDLRRFVPDFADRERAEAAVVELEAWSASGTIFIAPDNSLEHLRELALEAGKRVLVPTFGLRRGFVLLDGGILDPGERALAATLDGMERFGRRFGPADVRSVQRVDAVVTGATAITVDGRHIGGGQRYLAL